MTLAESNKRQEDLTSTTYEQALIEYEGEVMSKCYGCWEGCPDCLSGDFPVPPNPDDYDK